MFFLSNAAMPGSSFLSDCFLSSRLETSLEGVSDFLILSPDRLDDLLLPLDSLYEQFMIKGRKLSLDRSLSYLFEIEVAL